MVKINKAIRYTFEGKDYKSLEEISKIITERLGSLIDKRSIPIKERLALYDWLLENRKQLVELLSIEMNISEDALYEDSKNIFDLVEK
jgi:hypothetical protein